MAGGSGYILSKESVRKYNKEGLEGKLCDNNKGGTEDQNLGYCMQKLQVIAGDGRDNKFRERFFQFRIELALLPNATDKWVERYIWHDIRYGISNCCSETLITLHKITPEEMYLLEYFIYKAKIFGQRYELLNEIPRKLGMDEILKCVDVENWVMNGTNMSKI